MECVLIHKYISVLAYHTEYLSVFPFISNDFLFYFPYLNVSCRGNRLNVTSTCTCVSRNVLKSNVHIYVNDFLTVVINENY